MGVRERTVEHALRDAVVELGGETRKWVCPGHSFVPEQIVILPGCPIWLVEAKTVDGELSSGQVREHNRLRKAGAPVATLYGEGELAALLERIRQSG